MTSQALQTVHAGVPVIVGVYICDGVYIIFIAACACMHTIYIYVRGSIHFPTEWLTLALYGCILCVHAIMHALQAMHHYAI